MLIFWWKKFRKAFANKFSNLFPIFIIEMANLFIYQIYSVFFALPIAVTQLKHQETK